MSICAICVRFLDRKAREEKIDVLLFSCLFPTENHSKIAYFRAIFFYFIKQNASQCLKFGVRWRTALPLHSKC